MTRRGKAVVRIVPAPDRTTLAEQRRQALAEMRRIVKEITARNGRAFSHEELMQARDEGKR